MELFVGGVSCDVFEGVGGGECADGGDVEEQDGEYAVVPLGYKGS
ncbi:hypothetical protein OG609_44365 [Streptomyces sp. NBC_01224]|nr:hypothetical protein OG609_44365 [Streptomyces sp. NBC_01224]